MREDVILNALELHRAEIERRFEKLSGEIQGVRTDLMTIRKEDLAVIVEAIAALNSKTGRGFEEVTRRLDLLNGVRVH